MDVNLNFNGYISLNRFLGECQHSTIYVGFQDGSLLLYPLNTEMISINFEEHEIGLGHSLEISFNEDNPFLSEDITYRDSKYIIENHEDIYPIIKAMKVYEGVIDEDYDDTIEIPCSSEDDCRIGHYLIEVHMYYDFVIVDDSVIRNVKVIKDCREDDDS